MATQTLAAPAQRGGLEYKWLVVIAVVFGVFMSVLDSTIVNVALAKLQAVFGADLGTIQWIITGYTLALTVSIPLFGYLADRFSAKYMYLISLAIFTLSSALCGLAWSSSSLIAFRVLQGLGGGALLPLAIAQIYAVFPPEERGKSSAAIGIPVLFAPAIGPTLGGWLVDNSSWRFIFYINVPIGIAGLLVGWFILRRGRVDTKAKLDLPGLFFSTIGFASLVYGISEAESGWGEPKVIVAMTVGVVAILALILTSLRSSAPLLDFSFFKDYSFTTGVIITVVLQMGLFGSLFLLPVFLGSIRGQDAYSIGLILLPSALATIVVLPIGGILTDRIGTKWVLTCGIVALVVASYLLSHLNAATPLRTLQFWLVARSVGLGLSIQPAQIIALNNVPTHRLARASALYNVLRQVTIAFSTSILATYVLDHRKLHFAHLAERVTVSSPAYQYISQTVTRAAVTGNNVAAARAGAVAQVVGQLQRQAAVLSFQDAFLLTAGVSAVGVVVALFLKKPKKSEGPAMVME